MSSPQFFDDVGKRALDVFKGYIPVLYLSAINKTVWAEIARPLNGFPYVNFATQKPYGFIRRFGLDFDRTPVNRAGIFLWTESPELDFLNGVQFSAKVFAAPCASGRFGENVLKFQTQYANNHVALNGGVNFDNKIAPEIVLAGIFKRKNWFAGCKTKIDTEKGNVFKKDFVLGYSTEKFDFHAKVNHFKQLEVSFYHNVQDDLEVGFDIVKTPRNPFIYTAGIVCEFGNNVLRAKVNNSFRMSICFSEKTSWGVIFSYFASFDTNRFDAETIEFGMGVKMDSDMWNWN